MNKKTPIVLLNASVILAGLSSPNGGSGKILFWCKQNKIAGIASEVIVDEALRNASRIKFSKEEVYSSIKKIFRNICRPPKINLVNKFKAVVIDPGDAHVLASAQEENADFLVTLDKKHILVLQGKVKGFKIVSPGELIEMYHQQFKKG